MFLQTFSVAIQSFQNKFRSSQWEFRSLQQSYDASALAPPLFSDPLYAAAVTFPDVCLLTQIGQGQTKETGPPTSSVVHG